MTNKYNGSTQIAFESYLISAPDVKHPVTAVVGLPLANADRVFVYACGCVQTGGAGKTWKSYVHPTGPDANRLYSGTLRFVSEGETLPSNFLQHPVGMTKIGDYVASFRNNSAASGFIVSSRSATLYLGYLDDHYSDNGYWGHDDGTDNQCKDVGPAALEIAIYHSNVM